MYWPYVLLIIGGEEMNIIFAEYFEKEIEEKFQITKHDVIHAITNPDYQDSLREQELELILVVKSEGVEENTSYLLVLARKFGESDFHVSTTFRILPNMIRAPEDLEPLPLLYRFVNRFGMDIYIGNKRGKLIEREKIPVGLSVNSPAEIVKIRNPSKHSFVQCLYIKIEQDGNRKFANCFLAFCIDTDKYSHWLQAE